MRSVLVVEDEAKVAGAVKAGLEIEGFLVVTASSGEQALEELSTGHFDLVVLDLLLPGLGGLDVLRTLRAGGSTLPVLVLTARDAVEHRVEGLESGADDYLVKPFAFPELIARLRALLRRGRTEPAVRLRVADLELDRMSRQVRRGDRRVDLTPREFELLEYLLLHAGRLVSREMIARDVWKEPRRGTPLDNVIDVHVARLRRKIDQEATPRLIHTVRGVGFVVSEREP